MKNWEIFKDFFVEGYQKKSSFHTEKGLCEVERGWMQEI